MQRKHSNEQNELAHYGRMMEIHSQQPALFQVLESGWFCRIPMRH